MANFYGLQKGAWIQQFINEHPNISRDQIIGDLMYYAEYSNKSVFYHNILAEVLTDESSVRNMKTRFNELSRTKQYDLGPKPSYHGAVTLSNNSTIDDPIKIASVKYHYLDGSTLKLGNFVQNIVIWQHELIHYYDFATVLGTERFRSGKFWAESESKAWHFNTEYALDAIFYIITTPEAGK